MKSSWSDEWGIRRRVKSFNSIIPLQWHQGFKIIFSSFANYFPAYSFKLQFLIKPQLKESGWSVLIWVLFDPRLHYFSYLFADFLWKRLSQEDSAWTQLTTPFHLYCFFLIQVTMPHFLLYPISLLLHWGSTLWVTYLYCS